MVKQTTATAEPTRGRAPTYVPHVDILEKQDELTLLIDMPGAESDKIDVQFEDGTLAILGTVPPRHPDARYLAKEYGVGNFYRTFQVDESIDVEGIKAEYRDGVLTLHLPKVAAARPKKIEVKVK